MRIFLTVSFLSLIALTQPVLACGTRLPEIQQKLDAEQLRKLRALTVEAAGAADLIVIGVVTALQRPAHGSGEPGSVTLAVSETLKGGRWPEQVLAWSNAGVISCDQSQSFNNVGFRDGGKYIVYVKDGRVVRAAAADELRTSSLLKLAEERELVVGRVGE